jgi:hypothetical protein
MAQRCHVIYPQSPKVSLLSSSVFYFLLSLPYRSFNKWPFNPHSFLHIWIYCFYLEIREIEKEIFGKGKVLSCFFCGAHSLYDGHVWPFPFLPDSLSTSCSEIFPSS